MERVLFTDLVAWLKALDLVEVGGVIAGIGGIYLAAKNKIWSWPLVIVSIAIYIVVFWKAKLYADVGLQIYFMITSLYGWSFWSRRPIFQKKVNITRATKKQMFISIGAIIIFTLLLGLFLKQRTDASFPFIDSFCTACSLVAQFFLARKIIENWLIWIFADVIYIGLYIVKGLYPTAFMYALLIYIAIMGYKDWSKDYNGS